MIGLLCVIGLCVVYSVYQVQLLALRCLCLWKPEAIMPYKANLERLIEDEKYRDELTFFSVDEQGGQVTLNSQP